MVRPFEDATRVAIAEIIQTHARPGKFGYLLTEQGYQDLIRDLYDLLITSRSLKAAGDKIIQQALAGATRESPRRGRP